MVNHSKKYALSVKYIVPIGIEGNTSILYDASETRDLNTASKDKIF